MTCDDDDGNERKTLKAGHPSPSKRHGSTPDHPSNQPASWSWTLPMTWAKPAPHSLDIHCRVWKNDRTLASHGVCRTCEIDSCVHHYAFRPLGPRTSVGPGPSHHRHAGRQGLLGLTGPGRPAGRLLHLRSLWPRTWTCGCLSSLGLGRPVALTLGRKLKGLFGSMWVVHRISLLGLHCRFRCRCRLTSALLFVVFLLGQPGLQQPILADLAGRIFSTQSEALV